MPDHFAVPPPDILASSQKFSTLDLLSTIGRFAAPSTWPPGGLEHVLDLAFSTTSEISFGKALAWLESAHIPSTDLISQVEAGSETLRVALQQGNDARAIQLLAVSDASKLVELEDAGEASLSPRPLWNRAEGCLLLRLGYNSELPYAYYCASLPGDSRRPIKLTWQSVIAAGVTAAVAILPPGKPMDMDAVQSALHIMEQALSTAGQAHATILNLLKLPDVSAPSQPPPVAQAV